MINGVINVYKEPGYTSHDVVAKLRGILKQKKIGHMGTLDPNAVGVLPVCLGKATKLCNLLSEKDKTYTATMLLGTETDTQDTTGQITNQTPEEEVMKLSEEKVFDVIKSYIGEYDQIPPMFSAIKINGQKLYNLARKGEELTRTRVERFDIKDSISLSQIEEIRDQGVLEQYITPVDEILDMYSKCMVSEEAEKLLYNGNIFTSRNTLLKMNHQDGQTVRVYTHDGKFIGLYMYIAEKQIYKPIKIFL